MTTETLETPVSTSGYSFRLATPSDASAFASWAATNPQIDRKDLLAGMKANNPTVLTFVAEKNGVAIAFVPVYMAAVIAHLAFNPDAAADERKKALGVLHAGLEAFYIQYGITEIDVLTKPEYPVARWAKSKNFVADPRTLFRLDLNRECLKEAFEGESVNETISN